MAANPKNLPSEKNEKEINAGGGMSENQELVVSWGTSSLLHLGIGLLIVAAIFAVGKSRSQEERPPIYVPPISTIEDMKDFGGGSNNRISGNDEIERVKQNLIKDVPDPGLDVNGKLDGKMNAVSGIQGISDVVAITLGTGGGSPNGRGENGFGKETGRLAAWGPKNESRFLFRPPGDGDGTGGGGRVTKVAFVLDHSGSMVDTFDFLRDEVKRTVNSFGGSQLFSVIMFSEPNDIQVLGPPDHLQLALPSAKRDLFVQLDQIRASGRNDDLLDPFTKALGRAFAMNPQLIVFLTDGNFDPRLQDEVAKMNKGKNIKINTIAFVKISKTSEEQLQNIAHDNGGKYKFVSIQDLGR